MVISRRGFLGAILATGIAPAIARASSLMPVRTVDSGFVLPGSSPFEATLRKLRDLDRYEFAEYQAATLRAIAAHMGDSFERTTSFFSDEGW